MTTATPKPTPWPEIMAVWIEHSQVRTRATEGQYSPVWVEQARLVSSLLYGLQGSVWQNPDQEKADRKSQIFHRLACHTISVLLFLRILHEASKILFP